MFFSAFASMWPFFPPLNYSYLKLTNWSQPHPEEQEQESVCVVMSCLSVLNHNSKIVCLLRFHAQGLVCFTHNGQSEVLLLKDWRPYNIPHSLPPLFQQKNPTHIAE